ncbi:SIS domain-containing protein [Enterococcus cecorum]|uniref:SIS domain-containing protein n=1 Tax=Enterococcus cecorum TaxID=44008 RepID=UPI00148D9ED8|nr:SIS domain-containing protein [Enterococcus cecorum]MCJ0587491.1 SIS domain-containing protein [Enterococcus cecorum]MCJ0591290.1 SIS domain-containing protein [Enterococcus cecorum]
MALMDKYIDKTPEALGEVLNSKKRIEQLLADVTVDKIMLTGSGTSYHSGVQMKHWMSQITGIPVESYYPFQVCDDLFLTQEKVLFIGISQDGGSYSTYHAMQVAKQNHCILGSLSAYEGILLDEIADFSFTLPIEAEKAGPKTMGYSATKLQLLIIASSLSGKAGVAEEIKQYLLKLLVQLPSDISKIYEWVEAQKQSFTQAKEIKVVVPANYYGDGLEGALKMLETLRIPVVAYEYDEFIHGIYNAVDADSFLIFVDDGSEKNLATLLAVLSEWSSHIYVISNNAQLADDTLNLPIEKYGSYLTFVISLVFQVLASVIAQTKGINPDLPKDPNFHRRVGSKKFHS